MIRMNNISNNGVIVSKVVTCLDDTIKQAALEKYDEYRKSGVCLSAYDDKIWALTNHRDKYYFTFSFQEVSLSGLFVKSHMSYDKFIDYLKVYVVLLIGRCSLDFLREFISFTIKETLSSEFYSKGVDIAYKDNASLISYYYELVKLISPESVEYLEVLTKAKINAVRTKKDSKNNDQPCMLAEFQSYFLFDECITKYWFNAPTESKYFYFPLLLFWELTTILPLRVMEFCLTPFDCLSTKDGNYYITIRRTTLKGNNGSYRVIKHYYEIERDYKLYTYQINSKLYDLFNEYAHASSGFHRNYNLLFSLDFMQKYNPSLHKRDYDEDSIFDVEALNKLLSAFYNNVLIKEYGLSLVTETDLKERYVGMNDDSYGILTGEIMKIQAKHTRHLAMINLVYNGCNPIIIKEFAGQADERISANYYGNVAKAARCITKILYDQSKGRDIQKKILSSYSRSPLSLFIDESSEYVPLDIGKCYSDRFIKDDYSDCEKCGLECTSCEFFIPDRNADIRLNEDDIDEEMRLISTIIKRDDIDLKLTEYQTKYHNFQQKLGRYIEQTRRDLDNGSEV